MKLTKRILIILTLLCFVSGFSQNLQSDSLKIALSTSEEDTNKVILYQRLLEQIDTTDLSLAREYAVNGIELSKSLNYSKGRQACYFLLMRAYIKKEWFDSAQVFNLRYYSKSEKEIDLEGMRIAFMVNGGIIQHIKEHEQALKEAAAKTEQERKEALALAENRRQKIVIYAVSTGLTLIFLLAAVILRSLWINKKKNRIITQQKEIVEAKQKEILDSINYASRIQRALLPPEKYIERNLKSK